LLLPSSFANHLVSLAFRVRLIAAGHEHRATVTTFAGRLWPICPSVSFAVDLDFARVGKPSFSLEPPAFHLHL
jgi:Icc protein